MFEIGLVLVAQAALQPTASTGYLVRIERRLLHLGHAHADGLELGDEGSATEIPPAVADVAQEPRLVTGAHLFHLDARSVGAR